MENTLILWGLAIAFLLLVFVGVYLYRINVVANDFSVMKKRSEQNPREKTAQFLDRMNSKQLDSLLKSLSKKQNTE